MKGSLQLDSPAKINLRLEILKKRDDGYHELRTVLQKISLYDTLCFALKKENGITIMTRHPGLPVDRSNLVDKAARLMLKQSGYRGGVRITIKKKIPLGAGLGGGSSNAAVTIKALNQLLQLNLSIKEMMKIGVGIGVDVPFFLMEGAAIGTGIGDQLKKVDLPELWFVLINPNFEVSTRWAYQSFILTKRQFRFNLHRFLKTPEGIVRILSNDLEAIVSKQHPQIDVMKKIVCSAGALGALMTGSGPTVFGVFSDEGGASEGYLKIKKMIRGKRWLVLKTHSLSA